MEKIKLRQKTDFLIFMTGSLPVATLLFIFGHNIRIIFQAMLWIIAMFIFKIIYDFILHHRLFFEKEGLVINYINRKKHIPWSGLGVKSSMVNSGETKISFFYGTDKLLSLKMFYLNNDSIIFLTKKYCPPSHELYKIVEEHAKKNNLPF